jgi:hypothetical protein
MLAVAAVTLVIAMAILVPAYVAFRTMPRRT